MKNITRPLLTQKLENETDWEEEWIVKTITKQHEMPKKISNLGDIKEEFSVVHMAEYMIVRIDTNRDQVEHIQKYVMENIGVFTTDQDSYVAEYKTDEMDEMPTYTTLIEGS